MVLSRSILVLEPLAHNTNSSVQYRFLIEKFLRVISIKIAIPTLEFFKLKKQTVTYSILIHDGVYPDIFQFIVFLGSLSFVNRTSIVKYHIILLFTLSLILTLSTGLGRVVCPIQARRTRREILWIEAYSPVSISLNITSKYYRMFHI